jgi:twinkle protein
LQKAKQLILRHGINALIIDPWNKIQKNDSSKTETLQVQEMLNTLTLFKQRYNLHIFIVAHPRKMEKEKDTMKYKVPTLYDISSSSEFYNQADYGISVYRDWVSGMISMYVQKVKFKHLGEEGVAELGYNINNGRFSEWGNIINWDNSNHLIQTQEEIKINFEKFTPTQVIEEEEVIALTEAPF